MLSGEGPYFKYGRYLDGTLFDLRDRRALGSAANPHSLASLTLQDLWFVSAEGERVPLIRPKRGAIPHLTSFTLDSILAGTDREYEIFDLSHVWEEDIEANIDPTVIFLSTTFICDRRTMRRAFRWIRNRYAGTTLVLGGQYSNIKYENILREEPSVDYVVRGDGEHAIPALLDALENRRDLSEVPNLVRRGDGDRLIIPDVSYIDMDYEPSPRFGNRIYPVVPYESMRGCPFRCKFCSFPFASPEWRYKSARKIADDWCRYSDENGAAHIRALDSTFTVPPARMRELFDLLPNVPVTWEAYSRANAIRTPDTVAELEAAHCTKLSLGFESMSPKTLDYMFKKVTAEQNRNAHDLLCGSNVHYRVSFMVGYPGEAPEDYELTHRYLRNEFSGHFMLSVFSLTDETMPVWGDAERFQLCIDDAENPDDGWRHVGMDSETALALHHRTLDEVRRASDDAVLLLWQSDYHTPLVPALDFHTNLRIEKIVERLGMLPRDVPNERPRLHAASEYLTQLGELDVQTTAVKVDA